MCFQAHATLIAGVQPEGREKEVLAKAESLALEFKSISARVECTAVKDLYFQSVSFETDAQLGCRAGSIIVLTLLCAFNPSSPTRNMRQGVLSCQSCEVLTVHQHGLVFRKS